MGKQRTETGHFFQHFDKFCFQFIIFPDLYLYLIYGKWEGWETGTVEFRDCGLNSYENVEKYLHISTRGLMNKNNLHKIRTPSRANDCLEPL